MAGSVTPDVDVVIVGDGPAGSALAQACVEVGVDALLVGDDQPWTNTYGTWLDDLAECSLLGDGATVTDDFVAARCDHVVVQTDRRHDIARPYGLLDNDTLRRSLRRDVAHHADRVIGVDLDPDRDRARTTTSDAHVIVSRLVVDAAGWPPRFAGELQPGSEAAWQTAFGVVLADPPDGDLGEPTFMDFRPVDDEPLVTFAYSLPVADGWLVEETVLAARPLVDPGRLVGRLARRLGTDVDALLAAAIRTERVTIPMGGPLPSRNQPHAAYGAAAGGIHPISGYSIVGSIAGAPEVAAVIGRTLDDEDRRPGDHAAAVWGSIWSVDARRARVLLDYGLEMLLRLDAHDARSFFGTFFGLPPDQWAAFMRSGTSSRQLGRTMSRLFRAADLSVKRKLVSGNPLALTRLVRPR